ncbi:MAG: DUF2628 domain-containing protein [Ruminococcaceae bacterium]|nr:DUF2628 domain-containing protein [Oscillospiraceae bacterium]
MYCRFCGKELNDSDNFCVNCGQPAADIQNTAQSQNTQQANSGFYTQTDTVAAELIRKNKEYYIPVFHKLKSEGKYVSWNWPAFLAGPFWMVYRKLYLWAAGFMLVSLLLMIEGAGILLHVLAGLFGNYIYMKQIDDLTAQSKILSSNEQAEFVRKKGGVNTVAVIVIALLAAAFVVLIISLVIAFFNTSMFNSFNYYWWN